MQRGIRRLPRIIVIVISISEILPNIASQSSFPSPFENHSTAKHIPLDTTSPRNHSHGFHVDLDKGICREGWVKGFMKNVPVCIKLNSEHLPWEEARDTCRRQSSFLIKLENEVTIGSRTLRKYLKRKSIEEFWSGLHTEYSHFTWDEIAPHTARAYNDELESRLEQEKIWEWDFSENDENDNSDSNDDLKNCGKIDLTNKSRRRKRRSIIKNRLKRQTEDVPDRNEFLHNNNMDTLLNFPQSGHGQSNHDTMVTGSREVIDPTAPSPKGHTLRKEQIQGMMKRNEEQFRNKVNSMSDSMTRAGMSHVDIAENLKKLQNKLRETKHLMTEEMFPTANPDKNQEYQSSFLNDNSNHQETSFVSSPTQPKMLRGNEDALRQVQALDNLHSNFPNLHDDGIEVTKSQWQQQNSIRKQFMAHSPLPSTANVLPIEEAQERIEKSRLMKDTDNEHENIYKLTIPRFSDLDTEINSDTNNPSIFGPSNVNAMPLNSILTTPVPVTEKSFHHNIHLSKSLTEDTDDRQALSPPTTIPSIAFRRNLPQKIQDMLIADVSKDEQSGSHSTVSESDSKIKETNVPDDSIDLKSLIGKLKKNAQLENKNENSQHDKQESDVEVQTVYNRLVRNDVKTQSASTLTIPSLEHKKFIQTTVPTLDSNEFLNIAEMAFKEIANEDEDNSNKNVNTNDIPVTNLNNSLSPVPTATVKVMEVDEIERDTDTNPLSVKVVENDVIKKPAIESISPNQNTLLTKNASDVFKENNQTKSILDTPASVHNGVSSTSNFTITDSYLEETLLNDKDDYGVNEDNTEEIDDKNEISKLSDLHDDIPDTNITLIPSKSQNNNLPVDGKDSDEDVDVSEEDSNDEKDDKTKIKTDSDEVSDFGYEIKLDNVEQTENYVKTVNETIDNVAFSDMNSSDTRTIENDSKEINNNTTTTGDYFESTSSETFTTDSDLTSSEGGLYNVTKTPNKDVTTSIVEAYNGLESDERSPDMETAEITETNTMETTTTTSGITGINRIRHTISKSKNDESVSTETNSNVRMSTVPNFGTNADYELGEIKGREKAIPGLIKMSNSGSFEIDIDDEEKDLTDAETGVNSTKMPSLFEDKIQKNTGKDKISSAEDVKNKVMETMSSAEEVNNDNQDNNEMELYIDAKYDDAPTKLAEGNINTADFITTNAKLEKTTAHSEDNDGLGDKQITNVEKAGADLQKTTVSNINTKEHTESHEDSKDRKETTLEANTIINGDISTTSMMIETDDEDNIYGKEIVTTLPGRHSYPTDRTLSTFDGDSVTENVDEEVFIEKDDNQTNLHTLNTDGEFDLIGQDDSKEIVEKLEGTVLTNVGESDIFNDSNEDSLSAIQNKGDHNMKISRDEENITSTEIIAREYYRKYQDITTNNVKGYFDDESPGTRTTSDESKDTFTDNQLDNLSTTETNPRLEDNSVETKSNIEDNTQRTLVGANSVEDDFVQHTKMTVKNEMTHADYVVQQKELMQNSEESTEVTVQPTSIDTVTQRNTSNYDQLFTTRSLDVSVEDRESVPTISNLETSSERTTTEDSNENYATGDGMHAKDDSVTNRNKTHFDDSDSLYTDSNEIITDNDYIDKVSNELEEHNTTDITVQNSSKPEPNQGNGIVEDLSEENREILMQDASNGIEDITGMKDENSIEKTNMKPTVKIVERDSGEEFEDFEYSDNSDLNLRSEAALQDEIRHPEEQDLDLPGDVHFSHDDMEYDHYEHEPTESDVPHRFSYRKKAIMHMEECSERKPSMCYNYPITAEKGASTCGADWYGHVYLDMCYRAIKDIDRIPYLNYMYGTQLCNAMGGRMASIKDGFGGKFLMLTLLKSMREFNMQGEPPGIWVNSEPVTTSCSVLTTSGILAVDCDTNNMAITICEKPAINPGITLASDSKKGIPTTNNPELMEFSIDDGIKELKCEITGHATELPTLWFKDGRLVDIKVKDRKESVMPHEGGRPISPLPEPAESSTTSLLLDSVVRKSLQRSIDHILTDEVFQGRYWCEVWNLNPFTRQAATPIFVRFSDVITFVGTLTLPRLSPEDVTLYNKIQKNLDTVQNIEFDLNFINTVIFSSLQKTIPQVESLRTHAEEILGINPSTLKFHIYIKMFSNYTMTTEILVYRTLRKFYREFMRNTGMLLRLPKKTPLHLMRTINIRSTISCPQTLLTDPGTGHTATFPSSATNMKVASFEICGGTRIGLASCIGNYSSGAYWADIQVTNTCGNLPAPPTNVNLDDSDDMEDENENQSNEVDDYGKLVEIMTPEDRLKELAQMDVEESNVEGVMEETADIADTVEDFNNVDVEYIAEIMRKTAKAKRLSKFVAAKAMKTVDRVLAMERKKPVKSRRASQIIKHFETIAEDADVDEDDGHFRMVMPNIALDVYELHRMKTTVLGFGAKADKNKRLDGDLAPSRIFTIYDQTDMYNDVDVAIQLPPQLIKDAMSDKAHERLFMMVYKEGFLFQDDMVKMKLDDKVTVDGGSDLKMLNSYVISASIGGRKIEGLINKVKTVYRPFKVLKGMERTCAFYDFQLNNLTGGWSSSGCKYNGSVNGRDICLCDHLTNFAVLIDFYGQATPVEKHHEDTLSIITLIGLSLSILGLSLTIISYIFFRKLRQGRAQQTLFNLALAMLCSWVIFLVGIRQTYHYIGCLTVAALLHYFILASFMWMLMEAFLQYLTFVKVLGTYVRRYTLKTVLIAWGLPFVPVISVLSVDYTLYKGGNKYCWMSLDAFYYAFAIPIGVIILCNLVVFIVTVVSIYRRPAGLRSNQSKQKMAITNLQAAITSFVLLGLSWVLGYFAISDARLPFHYAFTILNSLQGFFIFVLFVARKKQVRDQWLIVCCCRQPDQRKAQRSLSASASIPSTCSGKSTRSSSSTSSLQQRTDRSDSCKTTTSFIGAEYDSIYAVPYSKASRDSLYYRKF